MDAAQLQSMMKGKGRLDEKDKYDVEIDKAINAYLDEIEKDEQENENKLLPKKVQRAKKIEEIKAAWLPTEVDEAIKKGFEVLLTEGPYYLPAEDFESLANLLKNIHENFEKPSKLEINPDSRIQELLHFESKHLESIFNMAVTKSKESKFEAAFDLFILLSTLVPDDLDYFYRVGVAAQEVNKLNLAIHYLEMVCERAPDYPDAKIFLSFCYIRDHQFDKAAAVYEVLNQIKNEKQLEEALIKSIEEIKALLINHKKVV